MFEIPIYDDSNGKKNATKVVGLVMINVCQYRRPGGVQDFLMGGSNL